jgi:hypothetical protein
VEQWFCQQQKIIDSFKNELTNTSLETQEVSILINLCTLYWSINLDSSLKYGQHKPCVWHNGTATRKMKRLPLYI